MRKDRRNGQCNYIPFPHFFLGIRGILHRSRCYVRSCSNFFLCSFGIRGSSQLSQLVSPPCSFPASCHKFGRAVSPRPTIVRRCGLRSLPLYQIPVHMAHGILPVFSLFAGGGLPGVSASACQRVVHNRIAVEGFTVIAHFFEENGLPVLYLFYLFVRNPSAEHYRITGSLRRPFRPCCVR